jgi:murein DD-endopeptidase MepM/ murein hydrolase activator NlpD
VSVILKRDRPVPAWSADLRGRRERPRGTGHGPSRGLRGARGAVTRLLVALLVALPLLGSFSVPAASGDPLSDAQAQQAALQKQISENQAKVKQLSAAQSGLNSQIASTKSALATVNANLQEVSTQVASLQAQVDEVKATYDSLVAQLKELQDQLALIEVDEHSAQMKLTERKALLAAHLRAAYMTDQSSILETVLSAHSFTDIISDVTSYLTIGTQDHDLAVQIEEDQQTLAVIHQSVEQTRQATDQLRQQTADQKAQLDAKMTDLKAAQEQLKTLQDETERQLALQQRAYASLASNKSTLQAAISADQAAQNDLQKKINQLLAQSRGNIPSVYNGSMIWPMAGVITQEYGCTGFFAEPPQGSCAHFHNGIDIATTIYSPIRAAAAGRILFAGPNPYDSNPKAWIVIIAHAQNLVSWYAHVDNVTHPITVQAGEWVSQGQIIAYEGMTGHTTGPHLHWMIELNDTFVNPRMFV